MDKLGTVTNLHNCSIFAICPYCALRHPYGGKRIMRSPHRKIFCESGIGNHDTTPIQYEKRTSKNNSVINDNEKIILEYFMGRHLLTENGTILHMLSQRKLTGIKILS